MHRTMANLLGTITRGSFARVARQNRSTPAPFFAVLTVVFDLVLFVRPIGIAARAAGNSSTHLLRLIGQASRMSVCEVSSR